MAFCTTKTHCSHSTRIMQQVDTRAVLAKTPHQRHTYWFRDFSCQLQHDNCRSFPIYLSWINRFIMILLWRMQNVSTCIIISTTYGHGKKSCIWHICIQYRSAYKKHYFGLMLKILSRADGPMFTCQNSHALGNTFTGSLPAKTAWNIHRVIYSHRGNAIHFE